MSNWQITEDGTFIYELGPDNQNKWWAHVQSSGLEWNLKDRQKVARLMHAAPELLEALESVVANARFNLSEDVEKAIKAIRKARGEA